MAIRVYRLHRNEDESGVSGVGDVAEAAEFENGRVAISWSVGDVKSVSVYESIDDAWRIHGHNGKTAFIYKGAL